MVTTGQDLQFYRWEYGIRLNDVIDVIRNDPLYEDLTIMVNACLC